MDDSLLSLLLIVLCLSLEGLFSGGEIALISSDINKIRQKAKSGSRSAALTLKLLERPEWFFSTALTGTNLCAITSTTIATGWFISIFGPAQGGMISAVVMVPTVLVMAEIIPKSICQQHAEFVATRICWFIWIASWILFPAVYLISKTSRGTARLLTGENTPSPYITREGLKAVLANRGPRSDILSREKEMVKRIFDFTEVTADKIMSPLSTMTTLPVTATLREATLLAAEKKYLRIPVYRDQIFNIIGILHYFDLIRALQGQDRPPLSPDDTIASCLRRAVFYAPETKLAKELLVELQKKGERMAIVVDEYGGAVGIVTIEDILEAIVGEIDDEYGEKPYKKIGPGKYLFQAQISVEQIRQMIPIVIPEGEYETLCGFLLYRMGRIPKRRETLRDGDILFVIEDADMKTIREVLVVFPPEMDRVRESQGL